MDELRFALVLDDHARATLDRVKGGLDETEKKSKSLGASMVSWVRDFSVHWAAIAFDRATHSVKELAHEVYEAAGAELANRKALAGVLAISDDTGASFEELKHRAGELSEEFADVAIKTGQSKEAMVDAFADMEARTGKPIAKVKELAMEMAQAGRAVPGGIGALTQGFNAFEMGVIRARNPLVMLIKASGMAEGNAKQIATALTKMGTDKAVSLAEMAISRMSDKMKKVPPGIGEVIGSLKQMKENVLETVGIPVLQSIAPHFRRFGEYLRGHRDEIEKWAKHAADVLGHGVEKAAELFKEGMQFLETHAEEIEGALKRGWDYARDAAKWLIENRDLMAPAAGAYAGGKLGSGLAAGLGMTGPAGAALTIGSMIIGSATVEIMRTLSEVDEVRGGQVKQMQDQAQAGHVQALQNMIDAADEVDERLGMSKEEWSQWSSELVQYAANVQQAQQAQSREQAAASDKMWFQMRGLTDSLGINERGLAAFNAGLAAGRENLRSFTIDAEMPEWVALYNQAQKSHNEAFAKYAAEIMVSSGWTADRLKDAGLQLEGGLDAFSKHFEGGVDALVSKLKSFMGEGGKKLDAPKMTFDARGSTFNIKQDFRDQDPDRVATVMRDDLLRAVEQRRGSRLATAFGF